MVMMSANVGLWKAQESAQAPEGPGAPLSNGPDAHVLCADGHLH